MSLHLPALREHQVPAVRPAIAPPASLSLDTTEAQLVQNVRAHLRGRPPCMDPRQEMGLFATLPHEEQQRVHHLLHAMAKLDEAPSVRVGADALARSELGRRWGWSAERLRKLHSAFHAAGDWIALVNRSTSGAAWQNGHRRDLPREFLQFVSQRFAEYRRSDGGRAAVTSIHTQWRSGRDYEGRPAPIPGYGFWREWFAREYPGVPLPPVAPLPPGWSVDNLRRRAKLTKVVRALCHEGIATARTFAPGVLRTREGLRFLEVIETDDVRTDFRVFDDAMGQVMDLWLLVARDRATNLLLGFVMRPARAREDGTQEHLRQADMKQLSGGIVERYGLPVDYKMTLRVERGASTVSHAVAAAAGIYCGNRLEVSYTGMHGGTSPVGYREKAKGNSNGKPSVESGHRALHIAASNLPGQTGAHYGIRPADLPAIEKETLQTMELRRSLPEHLQGKTRSALLSLKQAREHLLRIFAELNHREEHSLEGFEDVVVWRPDVSSPWMPGNTAPEVMPPGAEVRTRKQTPVERAIQIAAGYKFERISPSVLRAFYEDTERLVPVNDRGQIRFQSEKRDLIFEDPKGPGSLQPGEEVLAFFHKEDPAFLHLFHPRTGVYRGTWVQRDRVKYGDQEALAQAIQYSNAVFATYKEEAARLMEPQRIQREERLAHNEALAAEAQDYRQSLELVGQEFPDGTPADASGTAGQRMTPGVSAITTIQSQRASARALARTAARMESKMEDDAESALDALMPE